MFFYICKKCKRLVWFWQNSAKVTLALQGGKKRVVHLCFDCGLKIATEAQDNNGVTP
jgi:RNase P subunit RPR2